MNESYRLNAILTRIRSAAASVGRDKSEISLVAVSKTYPVEQIRLMYEAGATIFGENRVQEAREKQAQLDIPVTFHLIGRLQSNKVRDVVGNFALIQSVDRHALAEEINSVAKRRNIVQDVLIQLNPAGEEQKGGVSPSDADALINAVMGMNNLRLRGFMLIPPFDVEPEANRPLFRWAKEFFDSKRGLSRDIDTLSMGMSADFEIAIQEGSTMVRIGTALFGERS